jgi:KDEL-tailed cysteine endopeptidase
MVSVTNNQLHCISFALFLCLALFAFQATSRTLQNDPMYERHEQWMKQHGKVYKDLHERQKRFGIFKENVNYIETSNNAGNKTYQLGINHFADLANHEFVASRNKFNGYLHSSSTTTFKYENVTDVPSAVDWRQEGAVTPIKDQGKCGKFLLLRFKISDLI